MNTSTAEQEVGGNLELLDLKFRFLIDKGKYSLLKTIFSC